MDTPCPCGSGAPYERCCGPFHAGSEPETPETLMRSRYSAFVRKDVAYLWRTLHPDHDDRRGKHWPGFAEGMRKHFASRVAYLGLTILETSPPDAEGVASVTFRARMKQGGRDRSFTERSLFAHDGTGWRYLTGAIDP